MFMVKTNGKNGIPMPELVLINLLLVRIAPQKKISCSSGTDGGHFGKRCFWGLSPQNREGHRSSFLRSPFKLPKTTKKLSFHKNGHGIQKNDLTNTDTVAAAAAAAAAEDCDTDSVVDEGSSLKI